MQYTQIRLPRGICCPNWTYQHLVEVKATYGEMFSKLFIFPGDWHTLANFQPVLINNGDTVHPHLSRPRLSESLLIRTPNS